MVSMSMITGKDTRLEIRKTLERDLRSLEDTKKEVRESLKSYKRYSGEWVEYRIRLNSLNKRIKRIKKLLAEYKKPLVKEGIYAK